MAWRKPLWAIGEGRLCQGRTYRSRKGQDTMLWCGGPGAEKWMVSGVLCYREIGALSEVCISSFCLCSVFVTV